MVPVAILRRAIQHHAVLQVPMRAVTQTGKAETNSAEIVRHLLPGTTGHCIPVIF
jgi:hypothetical protein